MFECKAPEADRPFEYPIVDVEAAGSGLKVFAFRAPEADRPFVYPIVDFEAAVAAVWRIVDALLGTLGGNWGFWSMEEGGL